MGEKRLRGWEVRDREKPVALFIVHHFIMFPEEEIICKSRSVRIGHD
jgi:hypothetical protein